MNDRDLKPENLMPRAIALLLIATLANVAAADEIAVRVMSTVDVDARFAFTIDGPISVRGRANSEHFAGFGLVFDGRPAGPLQVVASVDVWWIDTRWDGHDAPPVWRDDPPFESEWRGECAVEIGAIHYDSRVSDGNLPATLRGYLRFATAPSAQLWESTAGGSSLGADFAWIAGAGVEAIALVDLFPVRFDCRLEAGVVWSSYTGVSSFWLRGLAQVAIGPALIGVEVDTLSGPRATPLDWRSLASVARVFVGFEWRT